MGKTYRSLQQWNQWLMASKGQEILLAEKNILNDFPDNLTRGKHGLLIGVPEQIMLLKEGDLKHRVLLTPLKPPASAEAVIESDPSDLPIASGSADLVILPHTLEYTLRPHHLLAEACRVVKPQGHIIIIGFNPLGWWGIRKMIFREMTVPYKASFLQPHRIKHWLNLANFTLLRQNHCRIFGTLYALVAEARVIPGTPIRLRWKQTLPALQASLVGPSVRNQV